MGSDRSVRDSGKSFEVKVVFFSLSPYLRFDTVTLPLGLIFPEENNPIVYSDWGKKVKGGGGWGGCASGSAGKGSETHVVLK